jgi:hypothetical protein
VLELPRVPSSDQEFCMFLRLSHLSRPCLRLGLAVVISCAAAQAQTTWYVDLNGTPPGTGSASDPYTAIQYAIDQPTTVSGDTLLVAPGEYAESITTQVNFTFKRLLIESMGGPEITLIRGSGVTVQLSGMSGSSELRGFTVDGMGSMTTGIEACFGIVRRCLITQCALGVYACVETSLLESTVAGNLQAFDHSVFDTLTIRNSIVWGNASIGPMHGVTIASYSVFSFNQPGTGNILADPSYWYAEQGDWRVKPGSVCIDAGDPASPLDPDGSRIDIGVFTYDAAYATGPKVYCTGKLNSQGCVPSIGSIGSCSASNPSPFLVAATGIVDNKVGLLFYGFGARAQPFQGALHCVQLPTKRTEGLLSGTNGQPPPGNFCSGSFSYDFNARIQSGLFPNLIPGAVVHGQFWYRDPPDPAGFGTGLTDAIFFGIAP